MKKPASIGLATRLMIILWVGLAFGISAPAQAEKRVAVIIANSNYHHAGVLPNPVNDGKLVAETFKSVGFETQLFLDLDEDSMGEAVDQLANTAAEADVLAVYYAGHAIQIDGQNYLIPTDAKLKTEASVQRQTITLTSLMDAMSGANISMLFLDACRDNPFSEIIAANETAANRSVKISRGIAVVRPLGDMLITFATLPNAVASDGEGDNSPFATSLARHIPTDDTEISVLMKRVTRDVLKQTGGEQRPQQLSQMQSEFYFKLSGAENRVSKTVNSILSVYPDSVRVGDEVALVADVPPACDAGFFNLTKSGSLAPIPPEFFTRNSLASGHLRHEISPGTRFGLVVQPGDEKGVNRIGFFCAPQALHKSQKTQLLRALRSQLLASNLQGTIQHDGAAVNYHFETYVIRDN